MGRSSRPSALIETIESRILLSVSLVQDINPGSGSSTPRNAVDLHGVLLFAADDGHGYALWRTDGSAAGTVMLKNLAPDFPPFNDSVMTAVNGLAYFTARDATDGDVLWKTDGTAQGTTIVAPGTTLSFPTQLTSFEGRLYFVASNHVWMTDGTGLGTVDVGALPPDGAHPQLFAGEHALYLCTTLHTYTVGTGLTELPGPRPHYYVDQLANLPRASAAVVGDELYYLGELPASGPAKPVFYKSDGTAGGTVEVADLSSEFFSSDTYLGAADGRVYFGLSREIWVSDGTAAGTLPLLPGTLRSVPVSFGGRAFLGVYASSLRVGELVESDGTPQGTMPRAMWSDTASTGYVPSSMTDFAGELYFNAAATVWHSDGTTQGTQQVSDWPAGVNSVSFLTPSGGRLFFMGSDAAHGAELWKLELPGTVAGSAFVDANHDGVRQPGEADLAGATVYLDANANGRLDSGETSTTTDWHGNYAFFNVPTGTYAVRQAPPAGYALTAPLGYGASIVAGDAVAQGPVFGDVPIASVTMNFDYLLTLAQNYGRQGTFATGDLTQDGQVGFDDLLLLAQNYGHPLAAPTTASTLPEASDELQLRNRRA